ncbi:MAG: Iron (III)-transport system permease HitB, partial [uncultured Nocardioides sp.]
ASRLRPGHHRPARCGGGGLVPVAASCRRAAVEHRAPVGRRRRGLPAHRRGRGVGRGTHRPAGPRLVARADVRPARGPGLRQRLRLGLHHPCRAVVRRRGDGDDLVLLPLRLPAHGGGDAQARPRRGGGGHLARARLVAGVLVGDPARDQSRRPRRSAARRAAPAGRVRRAPAAQLSDPDHGDPAAVRHGVQRPGGDPAGPGPGRVLPAPAAGRAQHPRPPTAGARRLRDEPGRCPSDSRPAPSHRRRRPGPARRVVPRRTPPQPGALAGEGHVERYRRGRADRCDRDHAGAGPGRRAAGHRCRGSGRLAGRAPPQCPDDGRRAERLHRQCHAGHRDRVGARHDLDPPGAEPLPDRGRPAGGLHRAVPAPRGREPARDRRAHPGLARRRGTQPGLPWLGGDAARHAAAGAARTGRGDGAGRARRVDRAHRDPPARADGHGHARHEVLVRRVLGRLRRRCAVRPRARRAVRPGDLAPRDAEHPRRGHRGGSM